MRPRCLTCDIIDVARDNATDNGFSRREAHDQAHHLRALHRASDTCARTVVYAEGKVVHLVVPPEECAFCLSTKRAITDLELLPTHTHGRNAGIKNNRTLLADHEMRVHSGR